MAASRAVSSTPKTRIWKFTEKKLLYLFQGAIHDLMWLKFLSVQDANVEGASGVSAPVFGPDGDVIAGLNLGAPSSRYSQVREDLIRIVRTQAAHITRALHSPMRSSAAV